MDIIQSYYDGFACSVGHSDMFEVSTGVRQGCALLFNLAIDWILSRTTEDEKQGLQWTLFSTLEDLEYADDLALLSHTHSHIQKKIVCLSSYATKVGLH